MISRIKYTTPCYIHYILLFHVYGSVDYEKIRATNTTWLKEFENNHDIIIIPTENGALTYNSYNVPYSKRPRVLCCAV